MKNLFTAFHNKRNWKSIRDGSIEVLLVLTFRKHQRPPMQGFWSAVEMAEMCMIIILFLSNSSFHFLSAFHVLGTVVPTLLTSPLPI